MHDPMLDVMKRVTCIVRIDRNYIGTNLDLPQIIFCLGLKPITVFELSKILRAFTHYRRLPTPCTLARFQFK